MGADNSTFAISTITRGLVVNATAAGTKTSQYDASGQTQSQLWTIEKSGDGNSVAFKNVSNGRYLRSSKPGDGAPCEMGDIQWWTLQTGDSPGSWWIKNNEHGNYLTNYKGVQSPNNTVWMWASNPAGWNFTMMWYINDTKASASFQAAQGGAAAAAASTQQKEDLDAREKAVADREKEVETKTQQANDKGAAAKKQLEEVETKQNAVSEREQQLESREKDIAERETNSTKQSTDLQAKEKAIAERQSKLESREKVVADKEASTDKAGAESKSGAGSTQVADLQKQLSETQRELEEAKSAKDKLDAREAEVTKREESAKQQASASTQTRAASSTLSSSSSPTDSQEIARLRQRIRELEARLPSTAIGKPPIPPMQSGPTPMEAGLQRQRQVQKPIQVQQDFGFLPRMEVTGRAPIKRPPPLTPKVK